MQIVFSLFACMLAGHVGLADGHRSFPIVIFEQISENVYGIHPSSSNNKTAIRSLSSGNTSNPTPRRTLSSSQTNRCSQPLVGNVDDWQSCPRSTRYYYLTAINRCRTYVGCANFNKGNDFDSEDSCLQTCQRINIRDPDRDAKCTKPYVTGLSADGMSCKPVPRYFYSQKLASCQQFLGCLRNSSGNNFLSLSECQTICSENVQSDAANNRLALAGSTTASTSDTSPGDIIVEREIIIMSGGPSVLHLAYVFFGLPLFTALLLVNYR